MMIRCIDLPKKGCFAKLLKRPTAMSNVTVSVAPDLCVGRKSLFLPFSNRDVFSVKQRKRSGEELAFPLSPPSTGGSRGRVIV
jgi:hypothetical protein